MPSGYAANLQRLWTGGVEDFAPADLLAMDAAQAILNGQTFERPGLTRRLGLNQVAVAKSSLGSGFNPMFAGAFTFRGKGERLCGLVNSASATSRLFVWDGGINGVLAVEDSRQWSPEAELVLMADRLYVLDPSFDPVYWQFGNTLLTPDPGGETAMPRASTGVFFKQRGYVGGHPSYPQTAFFSLLLGNVERDEEAEKSGSFGVKEFDWHLQQSFELETGRIVKIAPFHNMALVWFTTGGIEVFEPDPCNILTSTVTVASRNIGCGAKHSVQACGEDLLFVDREGHVRSLKQSVTDESQGVTNRPLSQKIRRTVARVNLERLSETRSFYFRGYYGVSWPMDGRPGARETWLYAIREQEWMGPVRFHETAIAPTTYPVHGWMTAQLKGDRERLFMLGRDGSNNAQIFRAFTGGTDDGTTIPFELTSRSWDMGRPLVEKTWQAVELRLRFLDGATNADVTFTVEARVDEGDWTSAGSVTFSPNASLTINEGAGTPVINEAGGTPVINDYSTQVETLPLTGFGRGHTIQFRVSASESASRWELVGLQPLANVDNVKLD